jgi:OFA family oxalate/formate antiporter-like MFS transporter
MVPGSARLAAGATAAGFGAGLTVIPIAETIENFGYHLAFLVFGLGQGLVVILSSWFLRAPVNGAEEPPSAQRRKIMQTRIDYLPAQVLGQPMFWLMYLIFVVVASGGLMAAAQLGPIAGDYGIADVPLSIAGLVLPALTLAIVDRILDGFGRPFFGWVSDTIGRENTMCIAFGMAGLSLVLLTQLGHNPWLFVLLTALFFGVFGEIYSLFPATCGDTFGSKYATTNAGLLYTAKGTASALVPLASIAERPMAGLRSSQSRLPSIRCCASRAVRAQTTARTLSATQLRPRQRFLFLDGERTQPPAGNSP